MTARTHLADDRPSDFRGRFQRRARGVSGRSQGLINIGGKRIAMVAAAVAVPAFAAPSDWGIAQLLGNEEPVHQTTLGFETPGESFPGSAFYYLADDGFAPPGAGGGYAGSTLGSDAHWDSETPRPVMGIARPLFATGTVTDEARALHCLTQAVYYEAASESDAGQRAVAQVVLNRVAHPAYPNTVCGVVYQGSERRTGCQFTFTCDGALARRPARFAWDRAQRVAQAALAGAVYTPVGLATHYHTIQVNPYWAPSLNRLTTIGMHIFYSWRGKAGRPGAFTDTYRGNEPIAAPHARTVVDPAAAMDPLSLEKAYESGLQRATALPVPDASFTPAPSAHPRPDYTPAVEARGGDAQFDGGRLPDSGSVKSEYARSGEWIAKP